MPKLPRYIPESERYINSVVQYLDQLVGQTITGICVDSSDPTEILFGLELDSRQDIAWIMADPEGNGPGHLYIVDAEPRDEPTHENTAAAVRLQKILDVRIPGCYSPKLRHETSKIKAAKIRGLLRDHGLHGISVRKGRGTASGYVDILLPSVDHEHPPNILAKDCAVCALKFQARQRLEQLILAAYPDLDDRSDYQTDYFDFVFTIQ